MKPHKFLLPLAIVCLISVASVWLLWAAPLTAAHLEATMTQAVPPGRMDVEAACDSTLCQPAAPTYNNLGASYIGPKTVHLSYELSDACSYAYCVYRLMGTPAGGGAQVELKREQAAGGTYIFTGAYHHANLDARTYAYSVIVERYDADNTLRQTTTPLTAQAKVTGDQAYGTLLFDEALEGTVFCGGIDIPQGKTLNIAQTELTLLPESSCSIRAYGTLSLDSQSVISVAQISLYSPHSFSDLSQANLSFSAGSEGSSLTSSSDLTVVTEVALAAQDIDGLSLQINQPQGNVTIQDVMNMSLLDARLAVESSVALNNVEYIGSVFYAQGACQISECPATEGTLDAHGLTITDTVQMYITSGAGVTIQDSSFRGPVNLMAATGHPHFVLSDFAGRVTVSQNTDTIFQGNVFMDAVALSGFCYFGETPTPTFETNSFLGSQALVIEGSWLCQNKIPVGANYYGDPDGPTLESGPRGFLRRGAYVDDRVFEIAPANVTGHWRTDMDVFPSFWLNNYLGSPFYRVLQSVARYGSSGAGELVQGKETLLSLELLTNDRTVNNVHVYAVFNGQTVEPTAGNSLTLHRDSTDYGHNGNDLGRTTVNFILPPTDESAATLEVWLDTRGVTGYGSTGSLTQLSGLPGALYFQSPPARELHIAVIPIQLPAGAASGGTVVAALESALPAMVPIPANRVNVRLLPPLVHKTTHWTTTGLLNSLATQLAGRRAFLNAYAAKYGQPQDVTDFIVAVMPHGSIGGADGASMALRRGVIFVDEGKPEAVFHEMGHGIGLYNTIEQYNWPNYPDLGMPLEDVTVFMGTPSTSSSTINGFFSACDAGRVCHIPGDNVYWAPDNPMWYDIMGAGLLSQWPSIDTVNAFRTYFGTLTPLVAATGVAGAPSAQRTLVISGQTRRVEILGTTQGYTRELCLDFEVIPDTVRIVELPATATSMLSSLDPTQSAATTAEASTSSGLPLCSYSDISNLYLRYDDAGYPSFSLLGNAVSGRDAGRDYDAFLATVHLYSNPTQLELAYDPYTGPALATFSGSGPLTTQILEPSPGATLPGATDLAARMASLGATDSPTFTLRWQTTGTTPSGQPLQYLVEYSADGGVTWLALGLPVEGDRMALPVDALPASDNLSLRVTASDGFRLAAGQVDDLTRPNLSPTVVIWSPADGMCGEPGTRWTLQASAYDPEDGIVMTGTWRTVTGALGSGPNLSGILLPLGAHTLTYEAMDSAGTPVSASVQVTVAPMPTVDLALPADALRVQPPQRDPTTGTPVTLARGMTNTVVLRLHNTGAPVTATLSLYVAPPAGVETLLARNTLHLTPFERSDLSAAFAPTMTGSYTFRGEISTVVPTDTNATNDTRSWTFSVADPPALTVSPAGPLDAGQAAVGLSYARTPFTLTNSGGLDLTVRAMLFEGAAAARFRLAQDNCTLATLAPGAFCTAMVDFRPVEIGPVTATLQISSTDPLQPQRTLEVQAVGYAPLRVYLPLVCRNR